ncbi:hypothetical protein [Amylibacter sp. SFDW26]|uniref:hypothetical protein n=1 Tax=Amylibacter sp. SFDW26 TaxID=2652722 RepID=UPI001D01D1FB|nr:hypothetical protein [Amylibacter sp. SFDW26]
MTLTLSKLTSIGLALGLLSACGPEGQEVSKPTTGTLEYIKVDTRLMSPELVNMVVTLRNPRTPTDVVAYVECAAAQYTLIRGFGFAGRVKLDVAEEKSGVWAGNAIYTLSNAHPGGRHTIDAEVTVEDCTANNVPTV